MWQPIETAPKDSQRVDLWVIGPFQAARFADCWWSPERSAWMTHWDDGEVDTIDDRCACLVTHWMPTPPPPTDMPYLDRLRSACASARAEVETWPDWARHRIL